MVLTELFTNIANAIRSKDGTTKPIIASEFPQRILSISNNEKNIYNDGYLGFGYVEDSEFPIVSGWSSISRVYANSVHMRKLSMPNYTSSFGQNSFDECTELEEVYLPLAKGLSSVGGFIKCNKLRKVYSPLVNKINQYAFQETGKLDNCDFSSVTSIGISAFSGSNAINLSFPSVVSIQQQAFYGCKNLKTLDIPLATSIGSQNGCYGCSALQKVNAPSLTSLGANTFYSCTSLNEFKFKSTPTSISPSAFRNCPNLLDIYSPWNEGEVANAPWGAVNATIHYNWTPESETKE